MKKEIIAAIMAVCAAWLPLKGITLYVDGTMDDDEACADDSYFNSLRDALVEAQLRYEAGEVSEENPLIVNIAPGVYWIDDPDDPEVRRPEPGDGAPFGMKLRLSHLRLKGLGNGPEDVVIAVNRGQTQGADGNFTMFHITGDDVEIENLTFGNYCNVDLDYPRNPSLNRAKREDAIVQAQLVICEGDRYVARDCRFISRLNLCPLAGARRVLFDNCYFECTDDALCGTGVYLGCRFTLFSGKPFYNTYAQGAVFLDCDLHSVVAGDQYLTKAGGQVAMVDCRWTSDSPDFTVDWTPSPDEGLRCYQHNLTLNGRPLLIGAGEPEYTVDMTGKRVLEGYKTQGGYNIYNLLKGDDGWNPLGCDTLSMPPVPVMLSLNRKKAVIETGRDTVRLESSRKNVTWKTVGELPGAVRLTDLGCGTCMVTGENDGEVPVDVVVTAISPEGLEAACGVTVIPPMLPAPEFTELPRMRLSGDSLLVEYRLELGGRSDMSEITWYRCKEADGSDAVAVAVSRGGVPKMGYRLTDADSGYYIMASVAPRHIRSLCGRPHGAVSDEPVDGGCEVTHLLTDFSDFPTEPQRDVVPGFWTVDAFKPADTAGYEWTPESSSAWYYGEGVDGAARHFGLLQGSRGARIMYQPVEKEYGDMRLSLTVDPCKSAGQGFGSATGQYMDVYIKFDPITLSGYALRIVRTAKNDKAVDFVLMRYDNGVAEPICAPVSGVCYRTGCHINLDYAHGMLSAKVTSDSELPEPLRAGLVKEVALAVAAASNPFGGVGIQHTGSTGASATLLRSLRVDWQ